MLNNKNINNDYVFTSLAISPFSILENIKILQIHLRLILLCVEGLLERWLTGTDHLPIF